MITFGGVDQIARTSKIKYLRNAVKASIGRDGGT
jgi:hypothetical protein